MHLLKVFLSSTCYDLSILRETIGKHIKQLGHEAVMSETSIYYEAHKPMELSCYNEVAESDILIHVIGGLFGSDSKINKNYSVAQMELLRAIELRKPILVFIDSKVESDYDFYKKNKEIFDETPRINFNFKVVKDYKVFKFIDLIKNKDLPVYVYDAADKLMQVISNHLSSLFHDRLKKRKVTAYEFFDQNYVNVSQEFMQDLKMYNSLSVIGLGQSRMIRAYGRKFTEIVERGGKVCFILTDPDGESTKMCAKRSSLNRDGIEEDIAIHKEAINRLLDIKSKKEQAVEVKIADIMFPYTIYAFNIENIEQAVFYIWFTPLFEPSEKRLGFRLCGERDPEISESFIRQFNEVMRISKDVIKKYSR